MNIQDILTTKKKTVLTITGGGTGAYGMLLENGGGSQILMEGIVNYAPESTHDLLGGEPDHYASEETARSLAVAAYNRCIKLGVDPDKAHGIAATSKLGLTHREERVGREHEAHVALHTFNETCSASLDISSLKLPRIEEEDLNSRFIIECMHRWYVGKPMVFQLTARERHRITWKNQILPSVAEVVAGRKEYQMIPFAGPGWMGGSVEDCLVFPGSFNPMHEQHLKMVEVAAMKTGKGIWLELSVTNTDKPQLDFITILERVNQIQEFCVGNPYVQGILITDAPLFLTKANIFPKGTQYIVGTDTYNRLGDPKYGDPHETTFNIFTQKQRLLVFPRKGKKYRHPNKVSSVSEFVASHEYEDTGLSSTEIRNARD